MFANRYLRWWICKKISCWDPLRADEGLLRIITKGWYRANKSIPFGRVSFEPNENDTDGISLFRRRWVSPQLLDASRRKPGTYYIVQFTLKEILSLGLTIRRTMGELAGHVVIPELCLQPWKGNPKAAEWAFHLTQQAADRVVLSPSI